MVQKKAKIISNVKLNSDCWKLTVDNALEIAEKIKPGQFVNLRIVETMDPLFRRPFAVFKTIQTDKDQKGFEIVYKVVGKGTKIMTTLLPGDEVDIIGPCGTGFMFENNKNAQVLLGGGIGATSLYMMGEQIIKNQEHNLDLHIFLGAETKKSLILVNEFKNLKSDIKISTDDGTAGYHGMVTELFRKSIEEGEIPPESTVYACGPEPMYRALRSICKKYNLSAQISIERRMACGMGLCLSCICKVKKEEVKKYRSLSNSYVQFSDNDDFGFALTCMDGPVFHLEEVISNES
jgi:dihydroorotate dehydrogenase electron transfer subunit